MSRVDSFVLSVSFVLSLNAIYFATVFSERIAALEQRPELELTCSIKDNQGRYVCQFWVTIPVVIIICCTVMIPYWIFYLMRVVSELAYHLMVFVEDKVEIAYSPIHRHLINKLPIIPTRRK